MPDSTFDMIGGLDQQVKEIKEVVELRSSTPNFSIRSVSRNRRASSCTVLRAPVRRSWREPWRITPTAVSFGFPVRN